MPENEDEVLAQLAKKSKIISFYIGSGTDQSKRTIDTVWKFTDSELEKHHNYIQWLFPLREKSAYNGKAPTLTDDDIAAFNSSKKLKNQLLKSFEVMLAFYGFEKVQNGTTLIVQKASTFDQQSKNWLNPGNHNYLRITRILKCLRLLGLPTESMALFEVLDQQIYPEFSKEIGSKTHKFWSDGVNGR
jgi:hypothetical protein